MTWVITVDPKRFKPATMLNGSAVDN